MEDKKGRSGQGLVPGVIVSALSSVSARSQVRSSLSFRCGPKGVGEGGGRGAWKRRGFPVQGGRGPWSFKGVVTG